MRVSDIFIRNDFLAYAFEEAKKAYTIGEVPVGAVLVKDNNIVAKAHNLVEKHNNPTYHAEMLALFEGFKKLNSKYLFGCDLYVTLEPCPMCAYAISLAKIRRLYFSATDTKSGGSISGPKIFSASSCHHSPEIIYGIMENESISMLKQFFLTKR